MSGALERSPFADHVYAFDGDPNQYEITEIRAATLNITLKNGNIVTFRIDGGPEGLAAAVCCVFDPKNQESGGHRGMLKFMAAGENVHMTRGGVATRSFEAF